MLFCGPGHCVMLTISFIRARTHPIGVKMRPAKTPYIDGPKIIGRSSICHPFGQRHPRPAASGNSIGVKAGADVKIFQLRRFAQDEITVGRKLSGPLVSILTPAVCKAGTRPSACSIIGSKWSKLLSSN